MYRRFFGLVKRPFDIDPDPEMVFMSEAHKEAFSVLFYGILEEKAFILLTGGVGSGKTTLVRLLLRSLKAGVTAGAVSNPTFSREDLYRLLSRLYGFRLEGGSKAGFLEAFEAFLEAEHAAGRKVALVVDEAHLLGPELLEELRLLSNTALDKGARLSVLLVGQPELEELLSHPRLKALRQRIGLRYHIPAFKLPDTRRYIAYRLQRAGARSLDIFEPDAVKRIHEAAGGCPRLINLLADQALLAAYAANKKRVGADTIDECARDLDLSKRRTGLLARILRKG